MPPLRASSSSGSDSDSDAPEAISLSHSRKSALKRNADIRKAEALVREKAKLKNRLRDRKLKERAANNKKDEAPSFKRQGKEKESQEKDRDEDDDHESQASDGIEARMLRAMRDAESKGSEDEVTDSEDDSDYVEDSAESQEGPSFDGVGVDEDDLSASGDEKRDEEGNDDDDEEMEPQEENSEDEEKMELGDNSEAAAKSVHPTSVSNYLPDELFKAAFSQTSNKIQPSQSKSKKLTHSSKEKKKRRRASSAPKDVIVGSKAIRTLSSTQRPVSSRAAIPSAKVNKFLNRTLALKSQKPVPGKGWERRPAHIGVLRSSGPAAHFVRNRS